MRVRAYLLMTAAAILVPIVVFSAVALQMLMESERRMALRSLQETARATALIIDRELSSAEAALRVLALSPHLASGDLRRFYEHARTADGGDGGRTILFAPDGQQLINTVVPLGTSLPVPPPGVPERTQRVIQTQATVVSGVIIGAVQRKPVTTINIPVPLGGGRQYVLGSVFDTAYFQTRIAQQPLPPGWVITVVDRQGTQAARSDASLDAVGLPASAPLATEARAEELQEIGRFDLADQAYYGAFTRSALSGWTVAVSAPVAAIEAPARRAVQVAAAGLLAALVLAGLAALAFGRRLGSSIRHAAASADLLGRGEAPAPANTRIKEVDELHRALSSAGGLLVQAKAERAQLLLDEREARQQAEEQNRLKDEFLAMLGHELRNPLSAIVAAVDLMEMPGVDARRLESARAILRRQSAHLAHVVDDLLDMTRVSKGKVTLDLRPLDLAAVARAGVAAVHAASGSNQAITLEAEPVWIRADRTRLDQIISNLLTNAVKFTPPGGRIAVRVAARENEALLEVSDTGIGIAPELMPRLFDIFVQGPTSIDRGQGGLGIGLSLVRELVTLHGGTVDAESEGAGRGSTFTVRFPRISITERDDRDEHDDRDRPAQRAETDAEVHVEPGPGLVRTHLILLVEDNEDARRLMAEALSGQGHTVLEAANGIEGLMQAVAQQPDTAIVDIGLPGVDGYELARRLRADSRTRSIALIALTGYGQQADRERALAAGFDMHLVKPASSEKLMEAMRAVATCSR